MLQKAPNVLGVTFAGAVNNTALPLDRDISKFCRCGPENFVALTSVSAPVADQQRLDPAGEHERVVEHRVACDRAGS